MEERKDKKFKKKKSRFIEILIKKYEISLFPAAPWSNPGKEFVYFDWFKEEPD